MNKRRLLELDALRGLAALAVVIYHYTTRYDELFGHYNSSYLDFKWGHFGVNLFFILSGFVIYMSINNVKSVKDFLLKRVIRLYPAYIFSVILTFVIVRAYGLKGREVSYIDAVLNLTMLQGFIPGVAHVDGVYWTLVVEMSFYLFIAFLLLLRLAKKVYLVSIIWLSSSAVIKFLNIIVENRLLKLIEQYSIANYCHLFIAGMVFYLQKKNPIKNNIILLLICLVYEYAFNDFYSNLIVTIFIILFYLLINEKLKVLNIKPLVFLGTISYSLYLVHQNIGYIIIHFLEGNGIYSELGLLIPIGLSILLSVIITFYIEKPIQQFLLNKRKLNAKAARKISA